MAHRMRSDCVLGSLGIWQAATAALLLHAVGPSVLCAVHLRRGSSRKGCAMRAQRSALLLCMRG